MNHALHAHTPYIRAADGRGLTLSEVAYRRILNQDEPVPLPTTMTWNAAARLTAQQDPRLSAPNLTTLYSLSGQVLLTDSVDTGWRLALLGEAGQIVEAWDGRGSHRQTTYDDLLRPIAINEEPVGARLARESISQTTHPLTVERFTYGGPDAAQHNQCNQLTRHDDPAGTLRWPDYSLQGSPVSEVRRFLIEPVTPHWPLPEPGRDELLEPTEYASCRSCNALGETLEQIDAMGNSQRFAQTVAGQLKSVSLTLAGSEQAETLVSEIHYNAFDQVEQEAAGNGVISHYTYDSCDGRLTELKATLANQSPLQELHYHYDPVGNILQIEDAAQPVLFFANQRIEPISHYRYDTLYQLIEATGREVKTGSSHGPALPDRQNLPPDPNQIANYTQSYDYDAGGNLLQMRHVGSQSFTRSMLVAPDSNRSLPEGEVDIDFETSFDANGNLQQLIRGQKLRWDVRNQLREVTAVKRDDGADDVERYIYDGGGQRCRKIRSAQSRNRTLIEEVRYLPGLEIRTAADGEILHVISAQAGRNSVRVLRWQTDTPAKIANDQLRYSLNDHLGSSTLELDHQGGLISQESYYPFGGTAWWAASNEVEAKYKTIRYSGKERDASGLYYYGFRYYAPWLQRWINPDPAGNIDGLNYYYFTRSNPLTLLDGKGTSPTPPKYAVDAYDRMFKHGLVWKEWIESDETGVETISRLSKRNIAKLKGELDSEQENIVAQRIADINPSDYQIIHFSTIDVTSPQGAHFKSLVRLQRERGDEDYEGNSMGGNIPNYANHDFAFFSLESGNIEPVKKTSRFGTIRYDATLASLGKKLPYTHMEITDLFRSNTREISLERVQKLRWLKEPEPSAAENFKNRVGLKEDKQADLLFYGDDMLEGLGSKIAVDLNSLSAETHEAVIEWTSRDRPLENLSEIINAFYRPQIAVPGGVKFKKGQYRVNFF